MGHDDGKIIPLASSALTAIADVQRRYPWWPWSPWSTYRLIKLGQLRAVSVGRRKFVTEDLLRDFVAHHTTR